MNALDLWTGRTPDRLFGSWNSVAKELDRMMEDFNTRDQKEGFLNLTCDIQEKENRYILSFDIPGMKRDDINIEISDSVLLVSGERKRSEDTNKDGVHRVERHFGRFERRFKLPEGIDYDQVEAQYEDGVLHLSLPKSEIQKPKKVTISEGKRGFLHKIKEKNATESEETAVNS